MELVRLVAPLVARHGVVRRASRHELLFHCSDADTIITTASLAGELSGSIGVWLTIDENYPAQLAARDVATLAHLVSLHHVVVDATSSPRDHADVLRSLLTNDEVTFTNAVATLAGAYNRPAPPSPVTVWSYENNRLVHDDVSMSLSRQESSDDGELTYFA